MSSTDMVVSLPPLTGVVLNVLGLAVRDIHRMRELVVTVDGREVFAEWGQGTAPNDVLNPAMPWLPPTDGSATRQPVQCCGCGEVGCGAIEATMRRSADRVEWTDISEHLGEFETTESYVFDAAAYEATIRRAHEHRPWESRRERVVRLVVEGLDAEHTDPSVHTTAWWSGDDEDAMTVSFTEHWRRPGMLQHLQLFEVPVGPADEVAERVLTTIRAKDPRAWPTPHRR